MGISILCLISYVTPIRHQLHEMLLMGKQTGEPGGTTVYSTVPLLCRRPDPLRDAAASFSSCMSICTSAFRYLLRCTVLGSLTNAVGEITICRAANCPILLERDRVASFATGRARVSSHHHLTAGTAVETAAAAAAAAAAGEDRRPRRQATNRRFRPFIHRMYSR